MPRASCRSSVIESFASRCAWSRSSRVAAGVAVEARPGHAEGHRERHEPGLDAVVQVALDAESFGGRGVDRTLPGVGEGVDAVLQRRGPAGAEEQRCERPVETAGAPHVEHGHHEEHHARRDTTGRATGEQSRQGTGSSRRHDERSERHEREEPPPEDGGHQVVRQRPPGHRVGEVDERLHHGTPEPGRAGRPADRPWDLDVAEGRGAAALELGGPPGRQGRGHQQEHPDPGGGDAADRGGEERDEEDGPDEAEERVEEEVHGGAPEGDRFLHGFTVGADASTARRW